MEKVTIEKLAKMINSGFEKVATKEQLGDFEKWTKDKINKLDKGLFEIKNLVEDDHRRRIDKLESRVEYLENIMDVSAKK